MANLHKNIIWLGIHTGRALADTYQKSWKNLEKKGWFIKRCDETHLRRYATLNKVRRSYCERAWKDYSKGWNGDTKLQKEEEIKFDKCI